MVGAGQRQQGVEEESASATWDPWIRSFEAAWRSGEVPSIDACLPAAEPGRQHALVELIHIDLEMRLKRGEAARVENYLARYPVLADDPTVVVELLAEEFRFRLRNEPDFQADELLQRFPQFESELRERLSAQTSDGSDAGVAKLEPQAGNHSRILTDRLETLPTAIALDTLVKQLADSGIISPGKLAGFVPPKANPKSVDELIGELVQQKQLTQFQAQQIAAGRAKALVMGGYTILDKIGAGGMGQVFKAEHRRMKRLVAIKTLPFKTMQDVAAVARFQREVEAAAKLRHANIVAADDADEAHGVHFLVMEYVDGPDLSGLVEKSGPLPVAKAVNYTLQAARGLQFAHREGIVHRDIKPANLLVDKNGTVKILDMGLARIDDGAGAEQAGLTGTGVVMGTVDYMAPEQALSSKHADARADIYSLGCSLYFLLTGRPAYDGETLAARLIAHQSAPLPDLRKARPEVPEPLAAVFRKMVAKKIDDRYQTMGEVIASLEQCGCDSPAMLDAAQPASSVEPPAADSAAATINFLRELPAKTTLDPPPRKSPDLVKSGRRNHRLILGTALGGVAGLVILATIFISLRTKDGTLVLEIDRPDAAVRIDGSQVEIGTPGADGKISISVDAGKHQLKVEKNGFAVFAREFSIDAGGRQSIKATLQPMEAGAVQPKEPWNTLAFRQWMKDVAALPVEKQVEAVAKKLQELNSGFDGKVTPKIKSGIVTELGFNTDFVTDISPVLALPGLNELSCMGTWGNEANLSDLSPLKGMPLTRLDCRRNRISDLSPLKGMPLTYFVCCGTEVSDLSPLKGMLLTEFNCGATKVADLSPLQGMKLTIVHCDMTPVSDLSPLRGMPLAELACDQTAVFDLSPLEGMSLKGISFTPQKISKGIDAIRKMKSLEKIALTWDPNLWISPADFWKKYDAGEFAKPVAAFDTPAFQQWLTDVAALPAEKQVEAVAKKLQELNPGYDGKLTGRDGKGTPKIENGVVIELRLSTDNITDIAPVRALVGLRALDCDGDPATSKLADLSPLQGMRLTALSLSGTRASDLSPLQGTTLRFLHCGPRVRDLSPLKGMPLTGLLGKTLADDLSPLAGMRLQKIEIGDRVRDVSPLLGMPIETATSDDPIRDAALLHTFATLKTINDQPAEKYWKALDPQVLEASTALARARTAAKAGKWDEVDAEFEKAVAARPNDPDVWRWRGVIQADFGHSNAAAADFNHALDLAPADERAHSGISRIDQEICANDPVFTKVASLRPKDELLWLARRNWFAMRGRWKEAADAFAEQAARGLRRPTKDWEDWVKDWWFDDAPLRLVLGDVAGYRRDCQEMLDEPGGTVDGLIPPTCSLAPDAVTDMAKVVATADHFVATQQQNEWAWLGRGMAEYRAGNWDLAASSLEKSLALGQSSKLPAWRATAQTALAMVRYRQGNPQAAKASLDMARQLINGQMPKTEKGEQFANDNVHDAFNWLRCQILFREADALLQGTPHGR